MFVGAEAETREAVAVKTVPPHERFAIDLGAWPAPRKPERLKEDARQSMRTLYRKLCYASSVDFETKNNSSRRIGFHRRDVHHTGARLQPS